MTSLIITECSCHTPQSVNDVAKNFLGFQHGKDGPYFVWNCYSCYSTRMLSVKQSPEIYDCIINEIGKTLKKEKQYDEQFKKQGEP